MMDIELYSEQSQRPFRERLAVLMENPLLVDLAIAYVSGSGAEFIQSLIDHLHGQAPVRLLVSVVRVRVHGASSSWGSWGLGAW
jgi:hypothetical protein